MCSDKEKGEAKTYIQDLAEKYGLRTVVFYLPFCHCMLNFVLPTPRKERIVQKFFPQLQIEAVHEWLNDGATLAKRVSDEKFNDVLQEFGQLSDVLSKEK